MRVCIAAIVVAISGLASESSAQSLMKAVGDGDVEHVKALLESGANANKTSMNNCTPIYAANKLEIVDLLIAHGAKLDIRESAGLKSPIEHFAESFARDTEHRVEWRRIVERLQKVGAEYTIDTAIYMNDIESVQDRLNLNDSWVNDRKSAQSVPLEVAAKMDRVEICKLLLDHKADPDSFEQCNGFSIMKYAATNPAMIKLLIDHGANLRRRITWRGDRSGYWIIGDEASILHYVVAGGNPESVKLLLEAGIDPTVTDVEGQTPLHIAVRFEHLSGGYGSMIRQKEEMTSSFEEIIRLLLSNDASLAFRNKTGKTPLQLAEDLESPDSIIRLLETRRK